MNFRQQVDLEQSTTIELLR